MRERINGLFTKITKSIDSTDPTVSTSRLQSYLILLPIIIMVVVFLVIELWSFIHALSTGKPYVLSNEIIVVFGMLLSHHLGILFSRNKSQSIGELKGINTISTATSDTPTSSDSITTATTDTPATIIKS